jgi:hypothetical protein
MIPSTEHQPVSEDGDDPVLNWRFDQLCALGFDDGQAFQLACSGLDLQLARKLIKQGCPPSLAIKIAL